MKAVNRSTAVASHGKGEQVQNRKKSKGAASIMPLRLHDQKLKTQRGK